MEKVIRKISLKKQPDDYNYWMSKTPQERIEAVEFLREQYLGMKNEILPRLSRVLKVIKQKSR